MALLKELKALLPQLSNPRFLHHLLEPLLLWGILFGVLAWILSVWVIKNRAAQVCSLVLLAVSSFSIFPLLHYRKKASPVSAPSAQLRDDQNERRRETQWVYYTFGSLAVLGIFMTGGGKGKVGTALTLGLAGGGSATVLFSLWLHEKEIAVFHPDARREIRNAPIRPATAPTRAAAPLPTDPQPSLLSAGPGQPRSSASSSTARD